MPEMVRERKIGRQWRSQEEWRSYRGCWADHHGQETRSQQARPKDEDTYCTHHKIKPTTKTTYQDIQEGSSEDLKGQIVKNIHSTYRMHNDASKNVTAILGFSTDPDELGEDLQLFRFWLLLVLVAWSLCGWLVTQGGFLMASKRLSLSVAGLSRFCGTQMILSKKPNLPDDKLIYVRYLLALTFPNVLSIFQSETHHEIIYKLLL